MAALSQVIQGRFSVSQRQMVDVIEAEFQAAGYPQEAAAAAVVNAIAESGLRPDIAGDGGKSVGLFQLHENGGGKGMSVRERQDPRLNARRIIEETRRGQGKAFSDAVRAGERDIGKLAGIFAYYVEHPQDKTGERDRRAAAARSLFPSRLTGSGGSGVPSRAPRRDKPSRSSQSNNAEALLTAGAVLLALVAVAATAATMRG